MKLVKTIWPQIFLTLILGLVFYQNYTPGTYLTGWDNLHPEFNLPANIKRSIFSTWQEYQGLGLLAGMAHAADLPRQLFLLLISPLVPIDLLRYVYHFLLIGLGTFGVYYLGLFVTQNKSKIPSFIGALFYLLNFGSIQYLSLPFEPYTTFWGFLPWLILSLFCLLKSNTKKNFLIFILLNFLAVPSFYVQTIFLVYLISVILILFLQHLPTNTTNHIKLSLLIVFSILVVNSFWLLPNIYFTLSKVSVTQNAMINLMVTDQFIEQNYHRGKITDFIPLRFLYYDIKDNQQNPPIPLFNTWHQHFSSPLIVAISYLFFSLVLLGAIFSKNRYKRYFTTLLLFTLMGLLSATFPFNLLNTILRATPLLSQIFRNSFTKLIVPCLVSLSILLTFSLDFLPKIAQKFSILLLPLLFIFSLPAFKGNYIHPQMRNSIPVEYFELFSFLKNVSTHSRIMNLPQYSFWGWTTYRWGPTGSGFLWYGIDQPIMDRAFDVWSSELENYYWQLHYALLTENQNQFNQILEKYNIGYVLFDKNVILPDAGSSSRIVRDTENLLYHSQLLEPQESFGQITLFKVKNPPQIINNVTILDNPQNINNPEQFQHLDQAYSDFGPYITSGSNTQILYPFGSLFTNRPEKPGFLLSHSDSSQTILLSSEYSSHSQTISPSWESCQGTQKLLNAQNEEKTSFFSCQSDLVTNTAYLIKITANNTSNRPLLFKVFSLLDNRLYADSRITENGRSETLIVVPPGNKFDQGIGINFSSNSYSNKTSNNLIEDVSISPMPYHSLISLKTPVTENHSPALTSPFNVKQPNQTFYKINLGSLPHKPTLALFQSYHPGWLAFSLNPLPQILKQHYHLSNWANGWHLENNLSNQTVYVIFLPQLLQYIAFFFTPPLLLLILRK
ncbi:MAG: hypothetical protein ACOX6N_00470 [Patescibacteria group bacterium]|jgi:hypothetical protein